MKNISSDIEFDAPTQVQMCSNISQYLKDQISHLQKTYTKNEFTTIIKQLADEDPLYYCEKQSLQLIYDKTVQHEGKLNGTLLADFATALKEKNKDKFHRQICLYKEYIQQKKAQKSLTIKSKALLNHLYEKDEMGYLTDSVYELLQKQEEVSIKKLQELIDEIEQKFMKSSRVSLPKKISLKKSSYQGENEQFEELLFDVMDKEAVDIESFRRLKGEILECLDDPVFSVNVEKEMNRLEDALVEINQRKIPSLKEEVISLTSFSAQLSEQLTKIYQQLDIKSSELYQTKTKLMELTEQNRALTKQLINTKIQLNQKEQYICGLSTAKNQIQLQLSQQKQSTKQFFQEYQDLQNTYDSFLLKLNEEQQKHKLQSQNNFFPTLSLKQQLQDAQFKVKRLKDQQQKLKNDIQNTQTAYIARIHFLQQQLEEAKNNFNRAENLKASGMSRLSINFQAFKQSQYGKKSVFDSVVSLLAQSKPIPENKKMSMFLDEVEEFMKQSKGYKLTVSKKASTDQNKNYPKDDQQIQDLIEVDKQLQTQYLRQSGTHDLKYNFCDIDFGELKKKLQEESPSLLGQQNSEQKVEDKQVIQTSKQLTQQRVFLSSVEAISKSGSKFKKYLMLNRKGVFMLDTKMRLQIVMKFTRISKLTFTYYNLDCFVISFKRKQSPMKKRITNTDSDMVFRCLRAKELVSFLSQPLFREKVLIDNRVRVVVEKEDDIWIRESTQKDIVLSNCGNFYNPFRINLSLKNHLNNFFYAQLSRQNFFSRSYIIICIVEESGVYCFQWSEDQMEKEKKFVYLLPLVKRMLFVRETESVMVKLVYEDWSEGKTFLLRFKNNRESLKFQIVCKERLKNNLKVIEERKKLIESTFAEQNNVLNESGDNSFQRQFAHQESQ